MLNKVTLNALISLASIGNFKIGGLFKIGDLFAASKRFGERWGPGSRNGR